MFNAVEKWLLLIVKLHSCSSPPYPHISLVHYIFWRQQVRYMMSCIFSMGVAHLPTNLAWKCNRCKHYESSMYRMSHPFPKRCRWKNLVICPTLLILFRCIFCYYLLLLYALRRLTRIYPRHQPHGVFYLFVLLILFPMESFVFAPPLLLLLFRRCHHLDTSIFSSLLLYSLFFQSANA